MLAPLPVPAPVRLARSCMEALRLGLVAAWVSPAVLGDRTALEVRRSLDAQHRWRLTDGGGAAEGGTEGAVHPWKERTDLFKPGVVLTR